MTVSQPHELKRYASSPSWATRRRHRRTFSVELIEMVRPNTTGYWPHPYCIEQAFETLCAFVQTGSAERYTARMQWGYSGIADLLSGGGRSAWSVDPISSLDDLRQRFHYALLSRAEGDGQKAWRQDHGITVGSTFAVERPVYKPFGGAPYPGLESEGQIKAELDRLLETPVNTPVTIALNGTHRGCRSIHRFTVGIHAEGFSFGLTYGDPIVDDKAYSAWTVDLARTHQGESFLDTFARARNLYDRLVHGRDVAFDIDDLCESIGDFARAHIAAQLLPRSESLTVA
jgi:hypothetical protein